MKKGSSLGGLEVNKLSSKMTSCFKLEYLPQRQRSLGEDGDNAQLVTPVKRRKQQEVNGGGLARSRDGCSSQSGSRGVSTGPMRPRGVQNSPRSRGDPNSPLRSRGLPSSPARPRGLRSAAIAASAAVASVVAGCLF